MFFLSNNNLKISGTHSGDLLTCKVISQITGISFFYLFFKKINSLCVYMTQCIVPVYSLKYRSIDCAQHGSHTLEH